MRKKGRRLVLIMLVSFAIITVITVYVLISKSPEQQAEEAINTFYTYEQDGAFSASWGMFHPYMKKKFAKGDYIQDRAHVFMNHFGVTSFTYELGEAVEVKNWKIEKGAKSIEVAYKVTVTQVFKGKYGNFSIVQDVYTTRVKGEWKVLWDYNR